MLETGVFFGTVSRMDTLFKGTQEARIREERALCRRLISEGVPNLQAPGRRAPPLSVWEGLI